ncbi:MAG TPA: fatty acid desaturase [Spirochaetota bacterium]|nr:fatty acid desaturase [Spirochaetota bacterium]HPS86236.1 fatty acid desaturase [Spirochaetota bacterium]
MTGHEWLSSLKEYEGADNNESFMQLAITFLLYFCLIAFMFYLVLYNYPYWIVILTAFPAAGLHVKIFIILHDCCHNSYFKSPRTCSIIGHICGFITFTPFYDWQRSHGIHHASVSNLERRGVGDLWTMTVEEYRSSSLLRRIQYRIYRNAFFLFGVAPLLLFVVVYRLPHQNMRRKDLFSIIITDIMIAVIIATAYFTVGLIPYLEVFIPVVTVASISGMWLFFIQHQFKKVYWSHSGNWDPVKAAMDGSSFYNLPGILRWFSGSIGYHHIHHLKPRIPNYKLRKCYNNIPELQEITPISIFAGFRSLFLYLWDEKTGELVNFSVLRKGG